MRTQPMIIGVKHLPDQIDSVEEALNSLIRRSDRIGIEPSPEDILLYVQAQSAKYPIDHLYEKVKERDNLEEFPIYELIGIKEFHEFYLRIYNILLEMGALPIGIGSRVRDTSYFDLIRRVYVNHETVDNQRSLVVDLILKPHFDHYVARRIREENLDGIIIGCDHQPISRIVDGNYIDLSGRDEDWALLCEQGNERLHDIYSSQRKILPQL